MSLRPLRQPCWRPALAFTVLASYEAARAPVESLFLSQHGSESLPSAWMFVALGAVITVAVYNRFAARLALMPLIASANPQQSWSCSIRGWRDAWPNDDQLVLVEGDRMVMRFSLRDYLALNYPDAHRTAPALIDGALKEELSNTSQLWGGATSKNEGKRDLRPDNMANRGRPLR